MTNKKWFKNWWRFRVVHVLVNSSRLMCKRVHCVLESGHDSIEDASACMELMNWKVSKDIAERAKKYGEHETKKNRN